MNIIKALSLSGAVLLPSVAAADWSGFYLGGSLGTVANGSVGIVGEDADIESATPFGVFLGYQQQSGRLVYGAEYAIAIDGDITLGDGSNPDTIVYGEGDLKARVGYDFGDVLAYGVVSSSAVVIADTDEDITASGFGFGFGADYAVSENFIVGGEFMFRDFEGEYTQDGSPGADDASVSANSLSIRASYKF